jgi:outer membrane immunogenic protein
MSIKYCVPALGLSLCMALAAPVIAADDVDTRFSTPYSTSEVNQSWAGLYAGAMVSYSFGNFTTTTPATISANGWSGGVYVGQNYQTNNFVYGWETDLTVGNITNTAATWKTSVMGSVRGRAGVAFDPFMAYLTAGVAGANIKDTATPESNMMIGWTAGVGVEALLTEDVVARVEYIYTNFSQTAFSGAGVSTDLNASSLRVGVGMKF